MLLTLLLCAAQSAPDRTDQFVTLAGLTVTEWAGAARLRAPLSLDVDWRGRVWVLEGGEKPRLSILSDATGGGSADTNTVFHEWTSGAASAGLALIGRQALVSLDGALVAVGDVDADGKAPKASVWSPPFATREGWCGRGAVGGPDGRVWFLTRDSSTRVAWASLDRQSFGVLASGAAQVCELACDSLGNVFASAPPSGERAARVAHVSANSSGGADAFDGASFELPGGDPRGLVVYESSFLPQLDGALLVADRSGRVRILGLGAEGASFSFEARELLAAKPAAEGESAAFHPVDLAVGIDGALFVLDEGDGASGARILRLAPQNRRVANPRLSLAISTGQLSSLLCPAQNVRASAFELLAAQATEVAAQVQGLTKARNTRWQARALFVLALAGDAGRAQVREFLSHEDPDLRLAALRALLAAGNEPLDLARRFAGDPALALRAEALRSVHALTWDVKRDVVLALLAPWPTGDALFLDTLALAVGADADGLIAAVEHLAEEGKGALEPSARAELRKHFAREAAGK